MWRSIDSWIIEQLNDFGQSLQVHNRWHYCDFVSYGAALILAFMTVAAQAIRIEWTWWQMLLPYLLLWIGYFGLVWPFFRREKRVWGLEKLGKWTAIADRMRIYVFWMRNGLWFLVGILWTLNVYGFLGGQLTFTELVVGMISVVFIPGGILMAEYLFCVYPAPPAKVASESKERDMIASVPSR